MSSSRKRINRKPPQLTRREWLAGVMAGGLTLALPRPKPAGTAIDRKAVVTRHNPVVTAVDLNSPLQIGNGEFAFTADVTGLQTFGDNYDRGMQLGTMSQWGWHSSRIRKDTSSKTFSRLTMRTAAAFPTPTDTESKRLPGLRAHLRR